VQVCEARAKVVNNSPDKHKHSEKHKHSDTQPSTNTETHTGIDTDTYIQLTSEDRTGCTQEIVDTHSNGDFNVTLNVDLKKHSPNWVVTFKNQLLHPYWGEQAILGRSRRFGHFFDALPRTETELRCCSNFLAKTRATRQTLRYPPPPPPPPRKCWSHISKVISSKLIPDLNVLLIQKSPETFLNMFWTFLKKLQGLLKVTPVLEFMHFTETLLSERDWSATYHNQIIRNRSRWGGMYTENLKMQLTNSKK
jgi:hypothetical protein